MTQKFYIFRSDGTLDLIINEGTVVDDHGLRFDGFQKPSYGDRRNNNLLHMLENFASEEDPGNPGNPPENVITNPLVGQFWFDKSDTSASAGGTLKVFNGVNWVIISSDLFTQDGPFTVLDGTASNQLTLIRNDLATIVIDNIASKNDLDDHINATVSAHESTAISFDDSVVSFSATEVQEAIQDVQTLLGDHVSDTTGAHDASEISFTPFGSFASNDVQDAIEEAEVELNNSQTDENTVGSTLSNHISDPSGAHQASAIFFNNLSTGFSANNTQDALEELETATAGAGGQSVLDSLRVVRNGSQSFPGNTIPKVQYNSIQFGDDFGQFNTVNNRYTADFNQIVRIRAYAGVNQIQDENRLELYIRKNGVNERVVEEWKWPEDTDPPGDAEASCTSFLGVDDFIEVFIQRVGGSGTIQVDTSNSRTALEIDVIKALAAPPPLPDVRLNDHDISDSVQSPTVAIASITVQNDGDLTTVGEDVIPIVESNEWHVSNPNPGIGNSFQVRFVTLSGGLSGGTADTWLNLSSSRTFTVARGAVGTTQFEGILQIRDIATLTIQNQANISLTASQSNISIGK